MQCVRLLIPRSCATPPQNMAAAAPSSTGEGDGAPSDSVCRESPSTGVCVCANVCHSPPPSVHLAPDFQGIRHWAPAGLACVCPFPHLVLPHNTCACRLPLSRAGTEEGPPISGGSCKEGRRPALGVCALRRPASGACASPHPACPSASDVCLAVDNRMLSHIAMLPHHSTCTCCRLPLCAATGGGVQHCCVLCCACTRDAPCSCSSPSCDSHRSPVSGARASQYQRSVNQPGCEEDCRFLPTPTAIPNTKTCSLLCAAAGVVSPSSGDRCSCRASGACSSQRVACSFGLCAKRQQCAWFCLFPHPTLPTTSHQHAVVCYCCCAQPLQWPVRAATTIARGTRRLVRVLPIPSAL
jgi:hypothetical protein